MNNYYLKQKVLSIKERYKIYDSNQNVVYYCKAKAFHPGKLLLFDAADKKVIYTLKRKIFSLRPGYKVIDTKKKQVANIKKRISFFQKKLTIKTPNENYLIKGSHWARDFTVGTNDKTFLVVHKKRLTWGDTYEIGIDEQADKPLMIAFVIMLDHLYHGSNNKKTKRRRR